MAEYICITCSNAGVDEYTFESTTLIPCPRCTSSAVVPLRLFMAYAKVKDASVAKQNARSAAKNHEPLASPSADVVTSPATPLTATATPPASQVSEYGGRWELHVAAVRAMLLRNKLDSVAQWWDGYHFLKSTSFDTLPGPGLGYSDYYVLRLINKNRAVREITFYFNGEDEGMTEVSDEIK